MKSERRHELQENDLAKGINDLPTFLRIHSNKLLIAVIVICLVVMLVRYRNSQATAASAGARSALQSARQALAQLRLGESMPSGEPSGRAKQRRDLFSQINATLDNVLNDAAGTGDAPIRAEALVARGDLNWAMSNLTALPGAATQPDLALPKSSEDYWVGAERAYRSVVSDYADQIVSKGTALLGLAAVAENRGDWTAANDAYNKVVTDAGMDKTFKDLARQRLALLPQIQMPMFVGSFSSTQPATIPSTIATTPPATTRTAE